MSIVLFNIRFYVRSAAGERPSIAGALVEISDGSMGYTDNYGMVTFGLPAGKYTNVVSAEGYMLHQGTFSVVADDTFTVTLTPSGAPLPEPDPVPEWVFIESHSGVDIYFMADQGYRFTFDGVQYTLLTLAAARLRIDELLGNIPTWPPVDYFLMATYRGVDIYSNGFNTMFMIDDVVYRNNTSVANAKQAIDDILGPVVEPEPLPIPIPEEPEPVPEPVPVEGSLLEKVNAVIVNSGLSFSVGVITALAFYEAINGKKR